LAAAARRARPRRAIVADPDLRRQLAEREVFSVSEIEAYLECPYRWFYERAVRADELERTWGAADQGEYAHALLHGTYARLFERGVKRVDLDTVTLAHDVLREVAEELGRAPGGSSVVEERVARAAAVAWAARVLGDDATMLPGFEPAYLEWEFGREERVELGSFAVRGRVDRIDVDSHGRAVVTDYKRSSAVTAANIVAKGKVQVPLYLAAVERSLGLTPVGGLYRVLRKREDRGLVRDDIAAGGGFVSTDVKSPEEFARIVGEGIALAEEAVAGMRDARITCAPRTPGDCAYCSAALVCEAGP
jgi:ATP-dependent helicase/nuclease subunit B